MHKRCIAIIMWITCVCAQFSQTDGNLQKLLSNSGIDPDQLKKIIGGQDVLNTEIDTSITLDDENDLITNQINEENIKNEILNEIKKEKSVNDNQSVIDIINSNQDLTNPKIDTISSKQQFLTDEVLEDIKNKKSEKVKEQLRSIELKKQYFGYDIFQSDPEIFQNSVFESIDPEYLIGPGDEIVIMLWGETEINRKYIVSKDGYLFIPNVGQVFVNSLTLTKLENKLFKLLKKVYSSLDTKTGDAATFFDVSLGSLTRRPLRVFVLGEVDQPGAYSVKGSTSLFSSLYHFRGPSISGSLRDVRLIRNGKEITSIDFYDYLLTGKQTNDIRLQRNDVVFIPNRGKTVRVFGEIKRNKFFELNDKEGLKELIQLAGGLKTTTYLKRATIDRIIPPEQRVDVDMTTTQVDVNLKEIMSSSDTFELYDGDIITFFPIIRSKRNVVTIGGNINRAGTYSLGDGLTLKQLILKADSLKTETYFDRVDITRRNIGSPDSLITLNLKLAMEEDSKHNIHLKNEDVISIYNERNMSFRAGVSITGFVTNPGPKPFKEGMKVFDLVFQGGGFENPVHLKNAYLDRAELTTKNINGRVTQIIPFRLDSVLAGRGIANRKVQMGDEIRIYSLADIKGEKENNTVSIGGFVKRPGTYRMAENKVMVLSDLLFMAGGFDDENHLKLTYLERADLIRDNDDLISETIIPFHLGDVLGNENSDLNFKLMRGDEIRIYSTSMFNITKSVTINGIILQPGEYNLKDQMTLRDLILEAGGVTADVYRYRVEVARIDPDNTDESKFAEIITVDLENNYDVYRINNSNKNNKGKKVSIDFLLKPYDVITIRPDPYFSLQQFVTINGLVYYPGVYAIRGPNEKVTDIIGRAGGLRPDAYARASEFVRNGEKISLSFDEIIKRPRSRLNFDVIGGDVISIGSKPNLVKLEGEVNSPGNYQYIKGQRLDDYIDMAGGYTKDATRFNTFIQYPDGTSKRISLLKLSPVVLDGSTIIVARKEEAIPFNFTEYVTNVTAIWTDVTQAWLMLVIALRSS